MSPRPALTSIAERCRRRALSIGVAALLVAAACKGPAPALEHAARQQPKTHEPRRVTVQPDVVAAARIRTAAPTRERLDAVVELPGETAADPDRVAHIAPPVAGRIESVTARLGAVVNQGDDLVTIRVPGLSNMRAEVASKQALHDAARRNADRMASLYQEHAASQRETQQALADASALDAQSRSASEVLHALGSVPGVGIANSLLTLRAPLAGTVITRDAVVGQPVTAEQIVATVADLRQVWFLIRVYEKDLARVQLGQQAEVVFNAYPDQRFTGTVTYLGQQVDPATRAVTARAELRNPDGLLRLGLFGTARLREQAQAGPKGPLVVPDSALSQIEGRPVVFIRTGEGQFEVREVVLGAAAAGSLEIVSGVRDGEAVVVDGAFTLKSVVLRGTLDQEE